MKNTVAIASATLLTLTTVSALEAQDGQPSRERGASVELMAQAGAMARVALETRVTRSKPYSAEAITEFVHVLSDGNRIVRKSTARLFRDNDGRTRREELVESGNAPERHNVVITDPVAGISLVLDAITKTGFKSPAMFARVAGGPGATVTIAGAGEMRPKIESTAPPPDGELRRRSESTAQFTVSERGGGVSTFTVADGGLLVAGFDRGEINKEDLGQQTIEGVTANGTRTTTVVPAGAIGNEQPITIVSEQWFSPDLEMLVLTHHSDPRVGETTYRVTNISRNEPDRTLFQAPADYTIEERSPVLMRRK